MSGRATTAFVARSFIPIELAERLAAEAERRGLSVSDLLIEYIDEALRREAAEG